MLGQSSLQKFVLSCDAPINTFMFRLSDVVTLGVGEQLRLLVRTKQSTLLVRLVLCGVLTVVACGVLFSMPVGSLVFFVAVFAIGLSVFIAARLLVRWDGTVLIITDRRCVLAIRRGFLKRSLVELPLSSIQGVEVGKNGLIFRASGLQREAVFPPIPRAGLAVSLVSPGGRSS
jgi:membrane protein YdbS with pleckstrin-like domain